MSPPLRIFLIFLRLGCTSFGGPVAHLGYFRDEFVVRRKWIGDRAYGDLVALCQFLPGPASSQVGIGIGLARGGLAGAVGAWLGFTLPSALAMIAFGYGVLAAVAVPAVPTPLTQLAVIALGGLAGLALLRADAPGEHAPLAIGVPRVVAIAALTLFFAALIVLPIPAAAIPVQLLATTNGFFASGALVFGGGHVVLPLFQASVVPLSPGTGWELTLLPAGT